MTATGSGPAPSAPRAPPGEPSAELFRQLDDDPRGAADVTEPIDVLVALHLTDELGPVGAQAGESCVEVVDRECEVANAGGIGRGLRVTAPARRGVELDQLKPIVAIRGLHHRELRLNSLEAHYAVHPIAPDRPLALQLESELGEERRRGRQVVNDDADVIHAFDRHATSA